VKTTHFKHKTKLKN